MSIIGDDDMHETEEILQINMSWYRRDTKVRIVGGGSMVKKPRDGILGTDEGQLPLAEGGESGKDRRLSKLHVCMYEYVRICRMHASLFNF